MAYQGTSGEHEAAQEMLNAIYGVLDVAVFSDDSLYSADHSNFNIGEFPDAEYDDSTIKDVFGKEEHNFVDVRLSPTDADGNSVPTLSVSVEYEDPDGEVKTDTVSVEADDMYRYVSDRDGRDMDAGIEGTETFVGTNAEDGWSDVYDSWSVTEGGREILVETKLEPDEEGNGQEWVTRTYEADDSGFEREWKETGDAERTPVSGDPMEAHSETLKDSVEGGTADMPERDVATDDNDEATNDRGAVADKYDSETGEKPEAETQGSSVDISKIAEYVDKGGFAGLSDYLNERGIDTEEAGSEDSVTNDSAEADKTESDLNATTDSDAPVREVLSYSIEDDDVADADSDGADADSEGAAEDFESMFGEAIESYMDEEGLEDNRDGPAADIGGDNAGAPATDIDK